MNLNLWLDNLVVITALEPRLMVEKGMQFMIKVNCPGNQSNL